MPVAPGQAREHHGGDHQGRQDQEAQASVNTTWSPLMGYGDSVCVTATYATTIDMPLVAAVARTLTATHCTPYEVYP